MVIFHSYVKFPEEIGIHDSYSGINGGHMAIIVIDSTVKSFRLDQVTEEQRVTTPLLPIDERFRKLGIQPGTVDMFGNFMSQLW